jgi:hypothetical protein
MLKSMKFQRPMPLRATRTVTYRSDRGTPRWEQRVWFALKP